MIPFHSDGHWVRLVAGRFALQWIHDTKNRRRLFGSKGRCPRLQRSARILCTQISGLRRRGLICRGGHTVAPTDALIQDMGWTSVGTYLLEADLLNRTRRSGSGGPSPIRRFGRAARHGKKGAAGMVLAREHQTYTRAKDPTPSLFIQQAWR